MRVLRNWQSYRIKNLVEEEINLSEFLNSWGHVGIYVPRSGHFLPGAIRSDFELVLGHMVLSEEIPRILILQEESN